MLSVHPFDLITCTTRELLPKNRRGIYVKNVETVKLINIEEVRLSKLSEKETSQKFYDCNQEYPNIQITYNVSV